MQVTPERFEELIADALDSVPTEIMEMMQNVVFLVEEEAPGTEELLGLYEGVPPVERLWGVPELPDVITIFRGPTLRSCASEADVVREVRTTVVHEIGHHFGLDDARLHELGWA